MKAGQRVPCFSDILFIKGMIRVLKFHKIFVQGTRSKSLIALHHIPSEKIMFTFALKVVISGGITQLVCWLSSAVKISSLLNLPSGLFLLFGVNWP